MTKLQNEVKEMIEKGQSLDQIKEKLVDKGFLESEIVKAISKYKLEGLYAEERHLKKIFTKEIYAAGIMLNIKVLDHIIIGDNAYYSFRDDGEV